MQNYGYFYINGERVNVMYRKIKYGMTLKIRSEKDWPGMGSHLLNEGEYLKENPQLLEDLKNGKVIKV